MHIGGTTIPSAYPGYMADKGSYKFERAEVVGRDGEGNDITAGYAKLTWSWEALTYDEYGWWVTTLLAGAQSVVFNSAQLYNHVPTLTTYSHCVVHAPTFEAFNSGEVRGVTVVIDDLRV